MKTRVVARRYAAAFYRVMEEGDKEAIYKDFLIFAEHATGDSEFATFLKHPALRFERKEILVRKFLEKAASPFLAEFVLLLLRKHRFSLFPLIVEEVIRLYKKSKSIVSVHVKSAVPLTEEEEKALVEKLNRRVRGTVELEKIIDPNLKGGLLICFEDKILDASVHSKLKNLKERMMSLSSELLNSLEELPSQLF
jgi:F-type H+-transporting ATPase subunit delta